MVRRKPTTRKAYFYGGHRAVRQAIKHMKGDIKILEALNKATVAFESSKGGSTISMVTISVVVFCSALSRSLPSIIGVHKRDLKKLERRLK